MSRETGPRLVCIGASAGGVEALSTVVGSLPVDLPAAMLVVMHVSAEGSALPVILERHGDLPARHARDGDAIEPGRIYVAPPDRHFTVTDGRCRVTAGPTE